MYIYENVRALTQEELQAHGFTSQQYVADATMFELDEWNALYDGMTKENKDDIFEILDELSKA